MREILSDLVAEQQFLDQSLQRIPIKNWDRVTPSKPWTVRDTISHLADFAELAADALAGGESVKEWKNATDLDALRQRAVEKGRSMRPQDVIEWWRGGRAKVVEPLSHMSEDDRVEWIEGSMSAKTFATFRLMETWAHGLDIYQTLQIEVEDTPRIRHVCWLGWKTLPYAFKAAGLDYSPIRVEVIGPGYAKWVYGPAETDNLIKGSASDWARLAVRRVKPKDTRLKVTGEVAQQAIEVCQAFL
ncbi:MAG TPA: maleylpyruvate isomerase family mycothiol-dependent enzyme [Acidimicrobiia bacterium]|nr:maleylpyruvate isomerase family mycothiol-dependent enzyme [Acidimicrobiia bacterium]